MTTMSSCFNFADDHSRVILAADGEKGATDYINGNFVDVSYFFYHMGDCANLEMSVWRIYLLRAVMLSIEIMVFDILHILGLDRNI